MFQAGPMGLVGSLGAVSKVILLILFLFSVISWAIILYKWRAFRSSDREDQRFLAAYARAKEKDELHRPARRMAASPIAAVFVGVMDRIAPERDGLSRSQLIDSQGLDPSAEPSGPDRHYLDRAVACIVQDQISRLEAYLPFLATTGNITPFIGLLGTVLGIIDAFREIGQQGTASIAAVAPGVAEALIATVPRQSPLRVLSSQNCRAHEPREPCFWLSISSGLFGCSRQWRWANFRASGVRSSSCFPLHFFWC